MPRGQDSFAGKCLVVTVAIKTRRKSSGVVCEYFVTKRSLFVFHTLPLLLSHFPDSFPPLTSDLSDPVNLGLRVPQVCESANGGKKHEKRVLRPE